MTFNTDTFTGLINQVIQRTTRYMVPREAQVVDTADPVGKGRVLVTIPALGWFTADSGLWCYPLDKNAVTTVAVGDSVIVQFVDGDPLHPVYIGKSNRIDDSLPQNYEDSSTQVLFENPRNTVNITYKEADNVLQLGNSDFRASARQDDKTISSSAEDSAFWGFIAAVFGVITGTPIPEPGNGAASALQAALSAAITGAGGTPTQITGKINEGSAQVQVGDA